MKYTLPNKTIAAIAGMAITVSTVALPAFASAAERDAGAGIGVDVNASGAGIGVKGEAKIDAKETAREALITRAKDRANQEVTRRINALNRLNARVGEMAKLSTDQKSSLSTTVQEQVKAMQDLQQKISDDANTNATSSLRSDIQSITKSYRIFALIIPQGALQAAADRTLSVAGSLSTIAGKLQIRITEAQTAGTNMSSSVALLADINAKVTDATTQTNAAISAIANLKPDNGDATIKASNDAALKSARTKIQAAQQDIVAARKDVEAILKALHEVKGSANASTTVNASTTP